MFFSPLDMPSLLDADALLRSAATPPFTASTSVLPCFTTLAKDVEVLVFHVDVAAGGIIWFDVEVEVEVEAEAEVDADADCTADSDTPSLDFELANIAPHGVPFFSFPFGAGAVGRAPTSSSTSSPSVLALADAPMGKGTFGCPRSPLSPFITLNREPPPGPPVALTVLTADTADSEPSRSGARASGVSSSVSSTSVP